MFDIAFSELVVILLVALIVIGPERLPKVARTMGLLFGRLQRFVTNVKNDITNDMAIEEARKLHDNIIKEAAAVEHAVQEDGRALQQQILQAQHQQLPEQASAAAPVAGTGETPVAAQTAAAGEQAPVATPAAAPGTPNENVNTKHS